MDKRTEHTRKNALRTAVAHAVVLCWIPFVALISACDDTGSGPGTAAPTGAWQQLSGGVGESNFSDVWGTSIDSLLATGSDIPLAAAVKGRWSAVTLPADSVALEAIWANSGNDIYVAGESGAAFHFDGNSWSSIPATGQPKFFDLCGTPAGEVFACADDALGPVVLRRANNSWEWMAGGFPELNTIWATDSLRMYVAGVEGYVARLHGTEWLPISRPDGFAWLDAWGTPDDEVFFVGDGGHLGRYFFAFQEISSPVATALHSISGSSRTHIFAVGDEGAILHYDGTAWTQQPTITSRDLVAVHVFDDGRAVALGELGTVLSFDGQGWRVLIEGEPAVLIDASGADADHVFFAGRNDAGDGMVRNLIGRTWTFPAERMRGIWAVGPNEAIIVGVGGVSYHFDGNQWTKMVNGALSDLNSVHGTTGRAYAVGDNGNLRYSNAPYTSWSAMAPPIDAVFDVRDVWVAAIDNVFAVGSSGKVLRYKDGTSLKWSSEQTGLTGAAFTAVAGRSGSDVTAVTDDGRVFHFDGNRWQEFAVPMRAPWTDVATDAHGNLLAVSSLPAAVMITGFDVGSVSRPFYLGSFHTGWIGPGTAYIAGAEGTIFRYTW